MSPAVFSVIFLVAFANLSFGAEKVSVDRGESVIVNCTQSGAKTVWIYEEGSILFIGSTPKDANPSKYSVVRVEGVKRYSLKISNAQPSDDGEYKCSSAAGNEYDFFDVVTVAKPKRLMISGDEDGLDEGSTGTLTCNVTSAKPVPRLTWRKVGQQGHLTMTSAGDPNLVTNADLTYSTKLLLDISVTKSLIGSVYVCEVTLDGVSGWNISQSHSIVINSFPSTPTITLLSASPTKTGDTYIATCETSGGRPAPNITWYLGAETDMARIQLNSSETSRQNTDGTYNVTSVVRRTAVRDHNQWRLTCSVINEPMRSAGWEARKAFTVLDIWYRPVIKSVDSSMTTSEGSALTLPCEVSGNPAPTIKWLQDINRVNSSSHARYLYGDDSSPSLRITFIEHSDEGKWHCVATNLLGSTFGTIMNVDVKHAPVFAMGPTFPVVGVVEGQDVTLTCKVKADPVQLEHLHWYGARQGKIEKNTTNFYMGVGNQSLTFTEVNRYYAGEYYCSAKNSLGTRTSDRLQLQVQYAPETIEVKSESKNYTEGSAMSNITCTSNGQPDVLYTWTKDGAPYRYNDSVVYFNDTAKPEYKGGYECQASNFLGSTSKQIFIEVIYMPRCVEWQKLKYGVSLGKSVTIQCAVRSNPRRGTRFVLTYKQQEAKFTTEFDSTDKTLYTANVLHKVSSSSDYGEYRCNASNNVGWMKEFCVIQVVPSSAADAPTNCYADNATDSSFDIECKERFDGGSLVTFDLQFSANGLYHSVQTTNSAKVKVTSQQAGTHCVMRLCASNEEYPTEIACSAEFNITTTGNVGFVKNWEPAAQIASGTSSSLSSFTSTLTAVVYAIIHVILYHH